MLHVLDDVRVDGTLEAGAAACILACGVGLDAEGVAGGGGWVRGGSVGVGVGVGEGALDGLVLGGQKDDFAVGGFGHGLHCLEVSDLHGGRAGEDVC